MPPAVFAPPAAGRLAVAAPAALVVLLALAILLAWGLQWDILLQVRRGYAPTQFNTALALLLAALSLIAQGVDRTRAARWLQLPVLLLAGATLSQDLSGRDLGIDRLLFEPHLGLELRHPGRMSPLTALSLLAIGIALALLQRGSRVTGALASIVIGLLLALALSSLLGYALDQRPLLGWRATTNMALPTAAALALLGLALQQALRESHRRRHGESPTPWWAELLVMAALLGSLLLWRGLVLADEQRQLDMQRREAQWVGQRLGRELYAGLLPLRRMATRWDAAGGTPEPLWRIDAQGYLRDLPGMLSVQWLDRDEVVRWVEPLALAATLVGTRPNREPTRLALLERARRSGQPALSEPLQLLQGGVGLLGFVPLRRHGEDDGFLVGVVRLDDMLDDLLAEQHLLPAVALLFGDELVYRSAGFPATSDPRQVQPQLRLPLFDEDPRWQLLAVLDGGHGKGRTALPELVLAGALLLAALLQVAVLLGWSSRQRALALQAAHSRLDEVAERARLATAAAQVGIWEWRPDSHSLIWDAQTWRHLGHAGAAPPPPSPLAALRAAASDGDLLDALLAALERGDAVVTAVLRVRRPDGQEAELLFDGRRADAPEAAGPRLTGVCLDITERRRLERLQREFVATVSHELRTPLTAINGALALLDAGQLGELRPPADMLVRNAHQNGLRLAALINDLLDWERLGSGGLRLSLQRQPLRPLLEQALALHREYAAGLQVGLVLDDAGLDPRLEVEVDAARLQQVLGNLLSNAAKFSPPGATVALGARRDGAAVELWVQDHGPGIPAEFLPRLFEKFSQADSSDTRRRGGTGLGLAISRELVRRMGGSIGVDSREGAGSRFWVRLPLAG
jgi:signal transduction histidine kinase